MRLRSLIGMFILVNMAMAMLDEKDGSLTLPASPSASGARSPSLTSLIEDRVRAPRHHPMSVTAYMHKSLTSKLSLTSRSTLTKWAIDGATKRKTWWGKALGATGGFLASAALSPFTAGAAVGGYLKNKLPNTRLHSQETITFYWRGEDLWCRLPEKTILGKNGGYRQGSSFLQDTKVAGIEGNFDNKKLVIRFEKTPGYQTASDRVIDTSRSYTNLKETLQWIRHTQEHQKYLDESVLQNLRGNEHKRCGKCSSNFPDDSEYKFCPTCGTAVRNVVYLRFTTKQSQNDIRLD